MDRPDRNAAAPPSRAKIENMKKIDQDSLRIALLAGKTYAECAKEFSVSPRTVRREVERAKCANGAKWPRVTPVAPAPRRARGQYGPPLVEVEHVPPPPNATPDQLEAWALAQTVELALEGEPRDRLAALRAVLEIARERRGRGEADAEPTLDVDAVRAAIADALRDVSHASPTGEVPEPC